VGVIEELMQLPPNPHRRSTHWRGCDATMLIPEEKRVMPRTVLPKEQFEPRGDQPEQKPDEPDEKAFLKGHCGSFPDIDQIRKWQDMQERFYK
jgi:hypothetical protein